MSKKKKKLSFSFHSLLSSSRCIFSYFLYFSLLFCLLSLTQLFNTAPSPHTFGTSLLFFTSLQMAECLTFYFFIFSRFLPSTLFTLNHNKCKSLTLTLLQPKSLSSALIGRMALLVSILFSSACPTLCSLLIKRS